MCAFVVEVTSNYKIKIFASGKLASNTYLRDTGQTSTQFNDIYAYTDSCQYLNQMMSVANTMGL